jgi:predicted aspartyl protease
MKAILPLLLLLVSGCAVSGTGSCEFAKVADLPVTFEKGVPIVDVKLNGEPVKMVFDTGADRSLIRLEAFNRLGLAEDPTLRVVIAGVGGVASHPNALVNTLEFGTESKHSLSIFVTEVPAFGDGKVDGLLGRDVMENYDVDLDMPHRRVGLYRHRSCPGGKPDWAGGFEVLPASSVGHALPPNAISVEVDGVKLNAIIDSGAGNIIIARASALRTDVTPDVLARGTQGKTQGATKDLAAYSVHRFHSLQVGSETIANPTMAVINFDAMYERAHIDMLIGEDYLRRHRVWIANGDHLAIVERPAAKP